ncbi:jerky protein homolog-like [Zeugodacus cucurbitae]|uniref:jerky protein homolog-like n=1 Tax=Zeugodacus cucurbitae TaxID=28588 RepID=UPI0023D93B41|nr:jerky protein homolog-like [Zeugodacus cucurbitae]
MWTVFMPPNVTALIQPMDQNAIRLTKLFYRNSLLSSVVQKENINTALKDLTLFNAVQLIAAALEKVSGVVLEKCWKNILINKTTPDDEDDEDNIPLADLQIREDLSLMESTLSFIHTVFPQTNFNTDDFEAWNSVVNVLVEENPSAENELAIEISEEGDTAAVVAVPPIKHTDAIDCFEKCIKWSEENNVEQEKIFLLKSLHQKAQDLKISRPQKQMSITNFFSVE